MMIFYWILILLIVDIAAMFFIIGYLLWDGHKLKKEERDHDDTK